VNLHERGVVFWIAVGILAFVVASPGLLRLLIVPRTEFFTELWILGSTHMVGNFPYNVSRNQNYSVFLGIGNQLGYCAYYSIEVKFRNLTQSAASSYNRTPSTLPALFNITAFVADGHTWELPLNFSLDYVYDETFSLTRFHSLTMNNIPLDIGYCRVSWDGDRKGFYADLFFELWLFNETVNDFRYHERFVNLRLNVTL
jgi:uncharacterized membrane protein